MIKMLMTKSTNGRDDFFPSHITNTSAVCSVCVCVHVYCVWKIDIESGRVGGRRGALTQVYKPSVFLLNSSLEIATDISRGISPPVRQDDLQQCDWTSCYLLQWWGLNHRLILFAIRSFADENKCFIKPQLPGEESKSDTCLVGHACMTQQSWYSQKKMRTVV